MGHVLNIELLFNNDLSLQTPCLQKIYLANLSINPQGKIGLVGLHRLSKI